MNLLTAESLKVTDVKNGSSRYLLVTPLEDGLNYRITSDGLGVTFAFFTEMTVKEEELGRMLFDTSGNWIYDGRGLTVTEQEDLAFQILNYKEINTTSKTLTISGFYERHL
ncbi:hypothetical protein [Mucilaginibacter aquariorum]|uniref:Uncharacterized protein n=1 Tax=Mucilaginibacter aquariorum TaxID=2967225 RepID=A0ABT1SXS9_9SPHI|nr:hypothetical protein [Mucilaginibacter aquariorum]MCQ6957067.1 hypothetical protein [Mucilaginibacter aquariorum]